VNVPGIDPDTIMSINGAVCVFFFAYVCPIAMHMKCYHGYNKIMNTIKRSLSNIGLIKKDTANDI